MKWAVILAVMILWVFRAANGQEVIVRVTNTAPFDRRLETIEVPWSEIRSLVSGNDSHAAIGVFDEGRQLVSQELDRDGDGLIDAVLFQSAFRQGEEKSFTLKLTDGRTSFDTVTDAKYVVPRKDVAWENDKIAFRIYGGPLAGDVRNGIDVWVKRVNYRIIDKWYHGDSLRGKERISYHIDHGEGADYFQVGRSLGGGGSAVWQGGELHQPGLFSRYRILATGPIRSVFVVNYEYRSAGGLSFQEERTFSLDAGECLNNISVRYEGIADTSARMVIGLVTREGTAPYRGKHGEWYALWGPTDADTSHGALGIGIMLPPSSQSTVLDDSIHYLINYDESIKRPLTYYAGACWTRGGEFATAQDWEAYLSKEAQKLRYPLRLDYTKN